MSVSTLASNTQSPLVLFGPELASAFDLDTASHEYRQEFLQNISELIIESALLRYFVSIDEASQSVFETWISVHKNKSDFLDHMRRTYPNFITILEEEILAFKQEAFRIGVDEVKQRA
ncbi:MAG: hypothetical protein ACK42D_00060 [Candidatus Paceibacteria bacterium]